MLFYKVIFFNRLIFITILFFYLMLIGCTAPTSITSKKDPAFDRKIERLFVVSFLSAAFGDSFAKYFEGSMISFFSSMPKTLNVEFLTVLELDLDLSIYDMKMKQFKPDTVMIVRAVGGTKNEFGQIIDTNIDISLFEPESEKIRKLIWRAKVFFTPLGGEKGNANVLAMGIINKLVEDGLI